MANHVNIGILAGDMPGEGKYEGWEKNLSAMKAYWEEGFHRLAPDCPDIILLPETCTMINRMGKKEEQDYYLHAMGLFQGYFADWAKSLGCIVMYGSIRMDAEGRKRNSILTLGKNGQLIGAYDKVFPTIWEMEDDGIIPGDRGTVTETGRLKAGYAICFDLNFEELRESYRKQKPDAIFFSSVFHGGLMQANWAFSTRSHFISSVRGMPSAIISPVGEILAGTTNYTPYCCRRINTDCAVIHLDYNIHKFKDIKKKYGQRISLSDPGCLGSVLLACEDDNPGVRYILDEYELMLLDDYLDKARAIREKAGGTLTGIGPGSFLFQ